MRHHILLLETIADKAMALLNQNPQVIIHSAWDLPEEPIELHKNISAVITRGKGQVRAGLMDRLPQLKVIARCGVGLDNIDVQEATKRGIKVVNAPNSNANTIAEHTIALMLNLQRNLYEAMTMVKQGRWQDRGTYTGDELHGKTLGILGMGNIGKKVAHIAAALGMKVIYWSASREDVPYAMLSFEEVLKTADVISLHLPLTPTTEHLIHTQTLNLMKPGALLINTARGKIIDQEALNHALATGRLGGFAADVLAAEPPVNGEALLNQANVLLTAHVGSLTQTTYTQMCTMTVENTLAILEGRPPMRNCIFNSGPLGLSQ